MSSQLDTQTRIREDGLRYVNKPTGTLFSPVKGIGIGSMSCFFCGQHRGSTQRVMQKVFGKSQAVCDPICSKNPKSKKAQE